MTHPVGETTHLFSNGDEPRPTVCAKVLKVIRAVRRCFCCCFSQKEQKYGIILDNHEVFMDPDGTTVLDGERVSVVGSGKEEKTWKKKRVHNPVKKSRPTPIAVRKVFIKPNSGECVTGRWGLSIQASEERINEAAYFVILNALQDLSSKIQHDEKIDGKILDKIFTKALNQHEEMLKSKARVSFDELLSSFSNLQRIHFHDSTFTRPNTPSLCYESVDEIKDDSEDSDRSANIPYKNEYLEELEKMILLLGAKPDPFLSAVFFKGSEDNPKAYGIFIRKDGSKGEYYLLDPYGSENGKISFHRFNAPPLLSGYLAQIAPAPLHEFEKNVYWICPLVIKDSSD